MSALRLVSLLALAVWIGGLLVLGGLVAPAVFNVLQAHDAVNGRVLAGSLFGEILRRFEQWSWCLGAVLLGVLGLRAALTSPPRRIALPAALIVIMLGMTTYAGQVIAPRIDAIRSSVPGAVAALADTDPRRVAFGRLHGLSTILMALTLLGGVIVLWTEARTHD
jgi:uncharacterized membrane protein